MDLDALTKFVGTAASPAWANARGIRANLDTLRSLVEGGLQQAVNAEADQGPEKLIDALTAEVEAAATFHSLPEQIRELRQAVQEELKGILDETRLQALGRVLTAKRRSQLSAPKIGETYTETKNAYEAFNVKVGETGRSLFENAGKQITWDHWVEVTWRSAITDTRGRLTMRHH